MLITSQFVVINFPKTGSSFVRAVMKSIYRRRRWAIGSWVSRGGNRDRFLKEILLPNIRVAGRRKSQHGTVGQIPPRYRDLPIMSVIRDPYARAVSDYRFRWWVKYPELDEAMLAQFFPSFPHLCFDEYLRLKDYTALTKLGGINPGGVGNMTVDFIYFFFREPAKILSRLSDEVYFSGDFIHDMADVTFLRQENLNDELAGFLDKFGFLPDELVQCRAHPHVNVAANDGPRGRVGWTQEGLHHFQQRERHFLRMLEVLGFHYPAPSVSIDSPFRWATPSDRGMLFAPRRR